MSKHIITIVLFAILAVATFGTAYGQKIDYLDPKPLDQLVTTRAQAVRSFDNAPIITWGGDAATEYARQEGYFDDAGFRNFSLWCENYFPAQCDSVLGGRTPLLRGTMGMINAAVELFDKRGIGLTIVDQRTWSIDGDCIVTRNIKSINDLKSVIKRKGKVVIALQLYGPHMDFILSYLADNNIDLKNVEFRWLRELTLPEYSTNKIVDPVSAFAEDESIDMVLCIFPDMMALTSDNTVGDGSEGSVEGAVTLVTTKSATRIIADVYACRTDYYTSNKSSVDRWVKALWKATEGFQDAYKANATSLNSVYSECAKMMFGSAQAVTLVKELIPGCEFVGYDGNVRFFTGAGTNRNLANMTKEIQTAYKKIGLISKSVPLPGADLDFADLKGSLRYATLTPEGKKTEKTQTTKRYDESKVKKAIEEKIASEAESWGEEGQIFFDEFYFAPKQTDFSWNSLSDGAKASIDQAIDLKQKYGAAIFVIEGHNNPYYYNKTKKEGASQQTLNGILAKAKTTSQERADNVKRTLLQRAKDRGLDIDPSTITTTGRGNEDPKFNPARTEQEWNENRRVVFRMMQFESESDTWTPLN